VALAHRVSLSPWFDTQYTAQYLLFRVVCRFLPSVFKSALGCLAAVCASLSSCSSDRSGPLCGSITGAGDGLHVSDCPHGFISLTEITYDATGAKSSYAFVATCGSESAHGIWSATNGLQCIDGGYPCEAGACTPTSSADCAVLTNCVQLGECGYLEGKCVLTEEGCSHSEISCGLSGACHLGTDGGVCTVMSDADCQKPFGNCPNCVFKGPCSTSGKCYAENGACVARLDSDCKAAQECAFAGKCSLVGGACVAATDSDCAASEVCRTAGQCAAVDGSCAVK
jgi:hypothetical protein